MRRALLPSLAVALAAALAACSVDVEGARCETAGSTAGCPSGQACGTGLTCSTRAASCTPCQAGATGCRAGSGDVMRCSAEGDPACGTWTVATACQAGVRACQVPGAGGAAECACTSRTVVPGAAAASCAWPSIHAAVADAARFPPAVVRLGGSTPATYGNELDDAAPIVVPSGVTVIGDDASPAAAENRIIEVRGTGPAGLELQAGASLRGATVRRADAAGPAVGVLVSGGPAAGGNALVAVRIDAAGAGGAFATGLRVAGANAVSVGDVVVQGATVAGLEVNRLGATDVVLVDQSVFDQNQVGVSLLKGDLTLGGSTVKRSVGEGINSATGTTGLTGLTVTDGVVAWNGTAGLVLAANDKLVVERTRICGNTGSNRTLSGQTRKVGGLFAVGNPPAAPNLAFAGNWVHDNGGDQVFVGAAGSPWDLSGTADCATANRNVFADYVAPGVGVAAVGATVTALFNSWGAAYPASGTDYTAVSGSVDAGTGSGHTDFCLPVLPADLVCPAP